MEDNLTLKIVFGKDQKFGIDGMIKEHTKMDKILSHEVNEEGDKAFYTIRFANSYAIYFFGYAQGKEILKYLNA